MVGPRVRAAGRRVLRGDAIRPGRAHRPRGAGVADLRPWHRAELVSRMPCASSTAAPGCGTVDAVEPLKTLTDAVGWQRVGAVPGGFDLLTWSREAALTNRSRGPGLGVQPLAGVSAMLAPLRQLRRDAEKLQPALTAKGRRGAQQAGRQPLATSGSSRTSPVLPDQGRARGFVLYSAMGICPIG